MNFDDIDKVGLRIKEVRKQKNITIQKLSQFTDLSVGYLSNLERNQASPTLANLQKICVVLDISVRDLLEPRGEERVLLRWDDLKKFDYDEYNLKIRRMDFGKKRGIYEYSVHEPDPDAEPSWGLHPYAEAGMVLEGRLKVVIDDTAYILEAGDSIYIKPHAYHTMKNIGDIPCKSFWHLQIPDDQR